MSAGFSKRPEFIGLAAEGVRMTANAAVFDKPVNVQARQLRRQFTLGRFGRAWFAARRC